MYDTVMFRLNCLEEEKRFLLSNFNFQQNTHVPYKRWSPNWSYQLDNLIIKIYTSYITIEGG